MVKAQETASLVVAIGRNCDLSILVPQICCTDKIRKLASTFKRGIKNVGFLGRSGTVHNGEIRSDRPVHKGPTEAHSNVLLPGLFAIMCIDSPCNCMSTQLRDGSGSHRGIMVDC